MITHIKRRIGEHRLIALAFSVLFGLSTAMIVWLASASTASADPAIRYVADDGNDAYACDSVAHRCLTIQHAIEVADPGDEIRVGSGAFEPIAITKAIRISGAFGPGFVDPVPELYTTMIDAAWSGSPVSITNAGDVTLERLTLTRGDGSHNCATAGCGGGLYANSTAVHVFNCVITNNIANISGTAKGGGIYAFAGELHLVESRVMSNTSNASPESFGGGYGGGVYVENGSTTIVANLVENNIGHVWVGGYGGGVYLKSVADSHVLNNVIRGNQANSLGSPWGSSGGGLLIQSATRIDVAGNRFEGNHATGLGGGIHVADSDATVSGNVIYSNTTIAGGGLSIESATPVTTSNNLIIYNSARLRGAGVDVASMDPPASQALLVNNTIADNNGSVIGTWSYAVVTLTNNLLARNTSGISVTIPASATIAADTNLFWNSTDAITGANAIVADPLLATNYRLRQGSPALDAGLTIPWLTIDLDGPPLPEGSKYDLGAYEGTAWETFLPLVLHD